MASRLEVSTPEVVGAPSRLDPVFQEHLERLKAGSIHGHTLKTAADWITRHTFLRGAPFSFKKHEFQLRILQDESREKVIRKCSQVGISELSARLALATLNILDGVTVIYTLPTADFAKTFAKTRFDPIIRTSPQLRYAVNPTSDNTQIKQFGQSFLYIKGTVGTNAAISVPADAVYNDEVDFSDAGVMSNYQSRLTHSEYKIKVKLSTPTVEGYGISAEFAASRRYWNMVKCCHCNEWFVPDYYAHVRVPGFYADLREVTKENVHRMRHLEAYLECPKCRGKVDLSPEHREWVLQNNEDNFEAVGYQIQPFDAPAVISCSDLIVSSTKYKRVADFVNFALGLPAEDQESSFSREELEKLFVQHVEAGFFSHVMGIDLGLICHIVISGVDPMGRMLTVHTERVPLANLMTRKRELAMQFRVAMTVIDSQPYTETVMRMQESDQNLFGAVYVTSKDLAQFVVKKKEEDPEEAKLQIRQVNVNRNKALDGLMGFVRGGNWAIREDANKEIIISHLIDMKRVKDFSSDEEMAYVWRKSAKGDDHFHHALLYCYIAAQMRGAAEMPIVLPSFVSSFRVKQNDG